MAENRAEFVLALDGDDSAIKAIFNAFKRTVKDSAAELEQTTSNITLFRGLKENLDKASVAVTATTLALNKLQVEVVATKLAGEDIGKDLAKDLAAAEKAANSANKEFAKQETAVAKMAKSLTTAGVNLKSLATEEIRLSTAAKQAAVAETERQAAATLGIKLSRDVAAGIQQQVAALATLKASGSTSILDIANAQRALAANTKAATAELNTGRAAVNDFGASLRTGLVGALLPFLGITAAITAVVSGFKDAISAARDFRQGLAEIGTVTNLSKAELDALGNNVREVARSLGLDLNEALKATFELLRSGVPKENLIDVLAVSAKAAIAGLADVGQGAKAASLLLDAFGASEADLLPLFDKIIKGAHDGGASFKEFANSAGPLLNVARAAGVDFDVLLSILTVMVNKSGDAEKSFAGLTKIIQKFDTAEVKAKLQALGITGTNLADVIKQIGDRQLTLNDVLDLGVGTAGKSAAALASLTTNAKLVPEELEKIKDAAGEVNKSFDTLFDSPKQRTAQFNAAIHDTAVGFGELFGAGSKFQVLGTDIVETFNFVQFGIVPVRQGVTALTGEVGQMTAAFAGIPGPAQAAAAALTAAGEASAAGAKQVEDAAIKTGKVRESLAELNKALLADVAALQAASAKDIADAGARADAQIAALDRSRAAESATAAATLAIRLKAAQDQFAIVQANEKKITDAILIANAARIAASKATGDALKKIQQDSAAVQLQAVSQSLDAYQKIYAGLVNLAQTAAARIQGFEEARVSIAQKVEDEIRGIRFSALSGLDQFVARNAEIDRLISAGRKAAAAGDTAVAKGFFDAAIAEAKNIGEVVDQNGVKVITAQQALTAKTEALNKVLAASNDSFGKQAAAAKEGADETIKEMDRVGRVIVGLQQKVDDLKASVAEGLKLKVEQDEKSIREAFEKLVELTRPRTAILSTVQEGVKEAEAALDELTKPRTVTVTVKTVNEQGDSVAPPESGPVSFARGGPVGPAGRAPGAPRERWFPASGGARALGFSVGGRVPAPRFATAALARALGIPPAATTAPVPPLLRPRDYPAPPAMRVLGFGRGFARGGPVFRSPSWVKVPGQGSGDTVPASLQAGSYVVRRSASRYYGDSLMSRLARGMRAGRYADGGPTTTEPNRPKLPPWRLFVSAMTPLGDRPKADQPAGHSSPSISSTWIRNYLGGASGDTVRNYDPIWNYFATGGTVTKDEIQRYSEKTFGFDPFATGSGAAGPGATGSGGTNKGDKKKERKPGDPLGSEESIQPTDPPVSFDSRPIPEELITAMNVIAYAREMLTMVNQTNPLLGVLLPDILDGIRAVEANPNNTVAVTSLLKAAETIGSNTYLFDMWGKTTSAAGQHVPVWFIDWLARRGLVDAGGNVRSTPTSVDVGAFAKTFLNTGFADAGPPSRAQRILGGPKSLDFAKRFFGSFAAGGSSGDTVPAMLTPGEWVIKKPAVRRYGTDFLHAVNTMAIPRNMLANIMLPPMPVSRFADGGQVISSDASRFPSSSSNQNSGITSAAGQNNLTVIIKAAAGDLFSEANVRRFVVPVLRDMIRKSS